MSTEVELERVTEHTQITTHVVDGLALLYLQLRGRPLFRAIVTAFLARVQELENALWDLLTETTLETAVGAALDQIGAILVFPRGTLTDDEDYRAVLRAVIRVHRSDGAGNDVLEVVALLLGDDFDFTYTGGRASILITAHAPLPLAETTVGALIRKAASAGIQLQVTSPPVAEDLLFRFSSSAFRAEVDATHGFSDVDQLAGGVWNGVV